MTKAKKTSEETVTRNWYAIYSKPRWEKKVLDILTRKGLEAYCPMNKLRKKWSDRIKTVYEPLFKSYVFVHISEEEKLAVRMTEGVINFVYWLGKPAVIKQSEIDTIRKFLKEHEDQGVEAIGIEPGQKVKVQSGVLMDKEGKVIKVMHNKVLVQIESLGYVLIATLSKKDLMPSERPIG
jgi:transcription antitermination factor NusG